MAGKTGMTLRVVSNRLPQLSNAIRPAVAAEVKKATLEVEAQAKAKAPVLTGTLRRSIHSVFSNGDLTGTVGPSVEYGLYVEFLHKAFMRPAAEAVLPGFADAVKRAVGGLK